MRKTFEIKITELTASIPGGHLVGTIRRVYASRKGVAELGEIRGENLDEDFKQVVRVWAEVSLTSLFNPEKDYLMVEQVDYFHPSMGSNRSYVLLAGQKPPQFPKWRNEDGILLIEG